MGAEVISTARHTPLHIPLAILHTRKQGRAKMASPHAPNYLREAGDWTANIWTAVPGLAWNLKFTGLTQNLRQL